MKFVSVDLETTGLDPNVHSTIEVGAVYADLAGTFKPFEFQAWVYPSSMIWDAYCLNLHKDLIQEILAKRRARDPMVFNSLDLLGFEFKRWLRETCKVPTKKEDASKLEKVTGVGKNFGSFDLQFLIRKDHEFRDVFRHRSLDPTPYYIKPEDETPPELKECKLRAGLTEIVVHRGLADAWDVVDLLQTKFRS